VRGENAKSFEFPKARFMGRSMESFHLRESTNHNVAAEVTRYTLSLSKGSDLFPGERVGIE